MKKSMSVGSFFSFSLLLLLAAVFVFAAADTTVSKSSTSCNGAWNVCSGANANGGTFASVSAVSNSPFFSSAWRSYGFTIPNGSIIRSVVIRADFWVSNTTSSTNASLNLTVSGNAGFSYGPQHLSFGPASETSFYVNVTNDLAWAPSNLSNPNLVINATCFKTGPLTNLTCRLDWMPVNVTYTPFDFAVNLNSTNDTGNADASDNLSVLLNLTMVTGISQRVNLSSTNCPPSATCSLSSALAYPNDTAVLTVATKPQTPVGEYNITLTAIGPGKTVTKTYTVNILSSCVWRAPLVSIVPDNQSGSLGSTLTYVTTVTRVDNTSCNTTNFNLNAHLPKSNLNSSFHPALLTLGPNASADTNFTITLRGPLSIGNYTFDNVATRADFSGSAINGTDTAFLTYLAFVFGLELNPTEATANADINESVSTVLNLTTLMSPTAQVNLSYAGCPSSANCSFSLTNALPNATRTFMVNTTSLTSAGNYLINLTGRADGGTNVTVVYNLTVTSSCVRNAPSVSITPLNQSGAAGSTLLYTTTVTNNDVLCAAANFSLSSVVPSLFNGSFHPTTLVMNAGAAADTNFSITSTSNVSAGDYNFTNRATGAVSGLQGEANATYTVI